VTAVPDLSVDMVFLDVDWGFAQLLAEAARWAPKLRVNGVLAGHDVIGITGSWSYLAAMDALSRRLGHWAQAWLFSAIIF